MPELLSPGVYIEERDLGPQPIEGVSTTTAGFVGEAQRGLTSGPPTLVTSFEDFQRKFGGFVSGMTLAYAMRGFFDNGGRRAYVSRVVGSAAVEASKTFPSAPGPVGFNVRILAVSGTKVTLSCVVGLEVGAAQLAIVDRATNTAVDFSVLKVSSATGVVTLGAAPGAVPNTHYARIPGATSVVSFTARDEGKYGNRVALLVDARYGNSTALLGKLGPSSWTVSSTAGLSVGSKVQFENAAGTEREVLTIHALNAATGNIETDESSSETFTDGRVFLVYYRLTVQFDGNVVETFDSLPTAVAGGAATAFADLVNEQSQWVRVVTGVSTPNLNAATRAFPFFVQGEPELLANGDDDAPSRTDVIGTSTPNRSGLKALEAQDGINILAAPGFIHPDIVGELIGQCERLMNRFAVFETGAGSGAAATGPITDINTVLIQRGQYNSRYAAMYHPWIRVADPLGTGSLLLPPTGHVLGCYARTDIERGVFKAPANVVIRGASAFSTDVTTGEQDVLNPAGVNVLRSLDGLGNVIWGARTISAEGLWKYVSVRRLFVFLEQSIVKGTRFAVFEPNDPRLWARLRDALVNFLTTQWRAGALFGAKPQEAFFVRVDDTTTTQDDRDNGRVNIIVGIAPVKPAEFIVFQIGQAPSSVIISEQS